MIQKIKVVNDPVLGFIQMPSGIGLQIVEHPWFQRLRNIKQLGIAYYVYPGAMHTRFQHSLGAYSLTQQAMEVLTSKNFEITPKESEAVGLAILLHDIGHGPFSHTLEKIIIQNISHEQITLAYMHHFNLLFEEELSYTIEIVNNLYYKHFLHQLVSSQLDMDRLDYLKRDSFYTGVTEGVIGTERIIKMLTISNDSLAIEEKGIYSIEKFLIARRLMYWQVYLHKTVLAAEQMLLAIFRRLLYLHKNKQIILPDILKVFWENSITSKDLMENKEIIQLFSQLDDAEVWVWIKQWINHSDFVLSFLSNHFVNRQLFKIEMQRTPIAKEKIENYLHRVMKKFNISALDASFLVFADSAENHAYSIADDKINILYKNGNLLDISEASDILNTEVLSKNVVKYFICYLSECVK
jgi:hypothetical protein